MPRTIKFHLDENVDPAIAAGLTHRGVDTTSTRDADLAGATDEQQMNYCAATGRVIFTTDQDFLRLHQIHPEHPGIVFMQQRKATIGDVIRGLLLIWELLEPGEMTGRIEYL